MIVIPLWKIALVVGVLVADFMLLFTAGSIPFIAVRPKYYALEERLVFGFVVLSGVCVVAMLS